MLSTLIPGDGLAKFVHADTNYSFPPLVAHSLVPQPNIVTGCKHQTVLARSCFQDRANTVRCIPSLDVLKIIFMVDAGTKHLTMCNLCPKYGSSAGNKRGATNGGRLY